MAPRPSLTPYGALVSLLAVRVPAVATAVALLSTPLESFSALSLGVTDVLGRAMLVYTPGLAALLTGSTPTRLR